MDPSTTPARILVVDDEPQTALVLERMTRHFGHDVVVAESVDSAIARFAESPFDVVLTDLNLGQTDGLELVRHLRAVAPEIPVVLITGFATMDSAMEAIQAGAYDYLAKPPSLSALGDLLARAVRKRRSVSIEAPPAAELGGDAGFDNIAGRSPQMLEVYKTVARVAPGRTSVLILGESGTGKELIAHALHRRSQRADRRFVPVNISAVPDGLLESELFGHVRGAFTGATSNRRGLFEEAHQGTLFLDEIGDLSITLQSKLLRVIQEHRIKPVGGNEEIEIDVRLVVATHQNLEEMVRAGRFREDLYYRLNVVSIVLPPLRERREDVAILLDHFLRRSGQESGGPAPRFTAEAMQCLVNYSWPGNVRELMNVVERAVLFSSHGVITLEALPERLHGDGDSGALAEDFATIDELVERHVARVLEHTGGNRTRAASILGVSRRTLHRMEERKRREAGEPRDNASQDATD